jgi:hypothetical protein
MAEKQPQITKADFHREVVKMATEDKAFRQQLLANPKQALKSAAGLELPASVDIQVLQEEPNRMYIVLPPDFKKSAELGDDELEAVAGGIGGSGGLTHQMQGFAGGSFLQRFGNEQLGGRGPSSPGSKNGITVIWG